jgi:REP element-mobilizing transposase RayT
MLVRIGSSMDPIAGYLKKIEKALQAGNATEQTHRPALKALIESLGKNITATNEPKRVKCGAPDFIIMRGQTPLGYIEAKDVGKSLDAIEADAARKKPSTHDGDQLKRFLESLGNLILTDYLEFRWYEGGKPKLEARLARPAAKGIVRKEKDGAEAFSQLINAFFSATIPTISGPKDLANRMAALARLIRDLIQRAFQDEDKGGSLHHQLEAFRKVLLHDLEPDDFADMYAQTICYGLFAARCSAAVPAAVAGASRPCKRGQDALDTARQRRAPQFTRERAGFEIPKTNPFLREMFGYIAGPRLDDRVTWAVDDLAELLNRADIGAILQNFGKRTRREDPVVHFYETFLAAYDPKMREARGVYYTPEPVVSYIVRSIDYILKNDFGLEDGLADSSKIQFYRTVDDVAGKPHKEKAGECHKVLILDPAVGTGTFLYGVIDQIHEHLQSKGQAGMWSGYVSNHLLPRLFGFELLMAPYAVAHMKLGLQLAETGYDFKSGERLRIYLTNTLEEPQEFEGLDLFASTIAKEANAAGKVKSEAPVMVILGNPPYSYESVNVGKWINLLIKDYYKFDGKPLGERNPKGLLDDYVKFIRFAQWRIEQTGYGILAFISNHSYIDNPTFRGMRQSVMKSFDDIYILDLHGSTKKKEQSPDSSKDENVFDIKQGVAISIMVKRRAGSPVLQKSQEANYSIVRHAERWGTRENKYRWLLDNDLGTTKWTEISPLSPMLLLLPQNIDLLLEYQKAWNIVELMPMNSVGLYTARDNLAIQWSKDDLKKVLGDFSSIEAKEAREKYHLGPDSRDWQVCLAQQDLISTNMNETKIQPISYRPFDIRFTYYTGRSRGFICMPRPETMRHMMYKNNIALCFVRRSREKIVTNFFVAKHIVDKTFLSSVDNANVAPLYVHPADSKTDMFHTQEDTIIPKTRRPNLAPEFIEEVSRRLGLAFIPEGKGNLGSTNCSARLRRAGLRASCPHSSKETNETDSGSLPEAGATPEAGRLPDSWPEAGATGKTDVTGEKSGTIWDEIHFGNIKIRDRGRLPHWEAEGALYFLTFRLADALPGSVAESYRFERRNIIETAKQQKRELSASEMKRIAQLFSERIEAYLDSGAGECLLAKPEIARLVADAIRHFDGKRYRLIAWCIMPNHVHVVFKPLPGHALDTIVHSWKSFSANVANKILGRTGTFWQKEYYDHLIRHEEDYYRILLYVLGNPEKANLQNWQWVWVNEMCRQDADTTARQRRALQQEEVQRETPQVRGTFGPEDIFDYMYAVFHSPTYRSRYAEFLKIDFPRLPLTSKLELFRELCALGEELVGLHLMEKHAPIFTKYPVAGDNRVEKVRYTEPGQGAPTGRVWINKEQYFDNVPPEVWEFHIGGYQVCEKWLKDRKGRQLSYDDLTHYQHIVSALAETIRIMAEIDKTINTHGAWPIQ